MNALTFEFGGTTAEADALARDLAAWLDDDEELAGAARVRMVAPALGEQGGLADAAELLGAVEPLLSAGVGAFGMWLAERARSRRISVRAVRPDGAELQLSAGSRAEAEAMQERLERFVAGGVSGVRTEGPTHADRALDGDARSGGAPDAGDRGDGAPHGGGARSGGAPDAGGRGDGGDRGDGAPQGDGASHRGDNDGRGRAG
ncbi:hypothetical protein [Streptomyces sp. NPDC047108]|uniref:effector-associated constant component EACC1 n=1 Tax=Streptomyces sp. NPDC047108 TaxID=3155025 RepID=UPI0033D436DB